jgi:hypothetical protein
MKLSHVRQSGKNRPLCEATVRLAEGLTYARERREAAQRRRGLPPGQCSLLSTYVVDGVHVCANHAGQLAVAYLLDRE